MDIEAWFLPVKHSPFPFQHMLMTIQCVDRQTLVPKDTNAAVRPRPGASGTCEKDHSEVATNQSQKGENVSVRNKEEQWLILMISAQKR